MTDDDLATPAAPSTRWRESLAATAARAYEAAHGSAIVDDRRGFRLAITARQVVAAVLAIVAVGGGAWWATRPSLPEPTSLVSTSGEAGPEAIAGTVVVDVAGAVGAPGLVELEAGARVAEALEAAGGATDEAELDQLNLARRVTDGEQIRVPRVGEQPVESALINVNTATASELDALPGIGPVLADRIVADRDANGPYTSLDDLARVSGVGEAVVGALAGIATV